MEKEVKKCNRCGQCKLLVEFPFSATGDKTRRIGFCEPCQQLVKDYNKKYRQSPDSASVLATCKKRWNESDHGKAVTSEYRKSDMNKEAQSKYAKSEEGKSKAKAFRDDNRLSIDLQIGISHLLTSRNTSKVVFNNTEFKSKADVVTFFRKQCELKGFDFAKYGIDWSVEHKIPRIAYDHDDPEDVLRCWSRNNMTVATPTENKSKNAKIEPAVAKEVPRASWPKRGLMF